MKKFALLTLLALELAVCGCGTNSPNTTVSTSTSGNWEARMTGGTAEASLLNFTTTFSVVNGGPLNITALAFFNNGKCFGTAVGNETEAGSTTLTTSSTNQVTGPFTFTVSSVVPAGNVLALTGNLTGTSNGTVGTTGTLSNGVVVGTWTLTGGQGDASCTGGGTFLMCQGNATCTAP
jgi:hypothetical protein